MARKVDPAKAKAARQKKIAIVLCVLLTGVLAFQGPRTLKMLKGPSVPVAAPAPAATPGATTPAGTTPPPPGTPGAAGGVVLPGDPQPAVLADSDLPATAGDGQLLSFEQFTTKDPFAQQVDPDSAAEPAAAASPPAKTAVAGDKAAAPPKSTPSSVLPGAGAGSGAGTPPTAGAAVAPEPPAAATSISVNGTAEDVSTDKPFPLADPIFVLVSAATDGKSVQIGIAGGNYADGKDTIRLVLGKALTLQNTADGSRYELELLTVQGFVPTASKP